MCNRHFVNKFRENILDDFFESHKNFLFEFSHFLSNITLNPKNLHPSNIRFYGPFSPSSGPAEDISRHKGKGIQYFVQFSSLFFFPFQGRVISRIVHSLLFQIQIEI